MSCPGLEKMLQYTRVKQEVTETADSSDDSDCPKVEDEKPGESSTDEEMMQWALRTLQRTQYLSDSENEDEKKEKSPVRVHSPRAKRTSENQVSWKNVGSLVLQLATPATQESSTRGNCASPPIDPSAVTIKEEPPPSPSPAVQQEDSAFKSMKVCGGDAVLPKTECCGTSPPHADIDALDEPFGEPLDESVSACSESVAALPPVDPCALTIVDVFSLSSEDTTEESAFRPIDWCGDSAIRKTECSTTLPPHADMDAVDELFEEPLEENASVCPLPVAVSLPVDSSPVSIRHEPPCSPSSSTQSAEEPVENSAFEPMIWCGGDTVFPKTECSTTPPPHAEIEVSDEPVEDPQGESASVCPMLNSSVVIIKDQPFFSSSSTQSADDPMEDSAFDDDTVLPKTECSTTPPPHVRINIFEGPIKDLREESVSAFRVRVSASPAVHPSVVTVKEEPPYSPSSSTDTAEGSMEDGTFEPMDSYGGDAVLPNSEYSVTPPSCGDIRVSEDSLGQASLHTQSIILPASAECVTAPSRTIQNNQFTRAEFCETTTVNTHSDGYGCTTDDRIPLFSTHSPSSTAEQTTRSSLAEDCGADPQSKAESFQTRKLLFSGDVSEDDWDKFVASVPPPRFPTTWTVRPSTPEEKAFFRIQEHARMKKYLRAFTYRLHGYECAVGPVRTSCLTARGPGMGGMQISDEEIPNLVTLVCDAVARLPNGVGSLGDILQLLSDSQFVKISLPWSGSLISKVVRELAMLSLENNPCLCYNAKNNMCVYVFRGLSEEQLEILYQEQPKTSEARKAMESCNTGSVEEDLRAECLHKRRGGPLAHSLQPDAQPIHTHSGKRRRPSNSGPQSIYIDPNITEQRCYPRKHQVLADSDRSVIIPTASAKESSATTSENGLLSSSLSEKAFTDGKLPSTVASRLLPSVSSLTLSLNLTDNVLSSSSSLTLSNLLLSSLTSSPSLSLNLANGMPSSPPPSSSSCLTLASLLLSSPSLSSSTLANGMPPLPSSPSTVANLLSSSPSLSSSTSANEVLSSPPSSSSSVSEVTSRVHWKQQQNGAVSKTGSVEQTQQNVIDPEKELPFFVLKMGVAPSDASVPNCAVNGATEGSTTMFRVISGDTTTVNAAKDNTRKDNPATDDWMMSKSRMCGASCASVTFDSSKPLIREGLCMKCYKYFVCFVEHFEDVDAPKSEGRITGAIKELREKELCSLCDMPAGGVGSVILKSVVKKWIHECKFCKRRYTDRRMLRNHEEICTVYMQNVLHFCLLCIGSYDAVNSLSHPILFNMCVTCPMCGQQLRCFFNLRVCLSVSQQKNVSLDIRGFSCIICGLQLKGKTSLNAHMKKHEDLSLKGEGKTFCCVTDPPLH